MQKRSYTSKQKVQMVLELLKGERMVGEIAAENGINPNMLNRWRREFMEAAPKIFDKPEENKARQREEKEQEAERLAMLKVIGQLTLERDYLQSATKLANRGYL